MSSDGYFDDDLDAAALDELDAIESTQLAAAPSRRLSPPPAPPRTTHPLTKQDSDLFDETFDVDETELQKLDQAIEVTYQSQAPPPAKPSSRGAFSRVPSKGGRQTTLFGDILQESSTSRKPPSTTANKGEGSSRAGVQRSKSSGELFRKSKKWDQTAFAKSGPRRSKSKKGKEKAGAGEDGGEEEVEFEQFPAPFVSVGPPPPMKLKPDLLAAKHWIYPLNRPKREYQFNISKHCLFDNTLVALPTGLGKTFIAGVIMLNFYRWFPEGKVVFVAPTKPLVAQQIDACHKTCGIPGRDAAELTGSIPKAKRGRAWQEKRVFYMTPQTLEHDLMNDNCDARDIVLLVVDEAHKGTGEYSYAKVVRHLMAKNPHFRLLALTATPGGNPETVQTIIDSLHISRIEIRNEESLDIRAYINKKKIEQHIITMNEGIIRLRDLLSKTMMGPIRRLTKDGLLHGNLDPVYLHPYRAQAAMGEVRNRPDSARLSWAYPVLKKVQTLARAMGYLLEASPQMCYGCLKEAAEDPGGNQGKSSGSKLNSDPAFKELMRELESQKLRGFAIHPKMETLKRLVIDHFGKRMEDPDVQEVGDNGASTNHGEQTRVMVFVSFREAVDEIVTFLNQESPLLRATKFIGQGTDKQGKKGFAQSEQLKVIERFKQGEYNILVSTSIGEEGLDIGEIDMIVCYESQKTPIRMLQRVGRTGRKRDGYVHVLLAEGREELNWTKAQDSYSEVQQSIVKGDQLEFYGDVERLLPDHIKPECLEMVMDIEEYDRKATEKSRQAQSPHKGATKRKRDDDAGRNIPPGASTGFVSVADLIFKQGGKKRKKAVEIDWERAGEDDDTDEEIQAGLFGPRRTVSAAVGSGSKSRKSKERRTTSMVDSGNKKTKKLAVPRKKKSVPTSYTLSQLVAAAADDSDDLEIERGIILSRSNSPKDPCRLARRSSSPDLPLAKKRTSASVSRSSSPEIPIASASRSGHGFLATLSSSPDIPLAKDGNVIDICTPSVATPSSPQRIPSSSPGRPLRRQGRTKTASSPRQSTTQSSGPALQPNSSSAPRDEEDLSWLLAESDDGDARSSPVRFVSPAHEPMLDISDVEIVEDKAFDILDQTIDISSSPACAAEPSASERARRDMPPPAIPLRFTAAPKVISPPEEDAPEPSFMVRAIGKGKKRAVDVPKTDSSPFDPPSLKRLRRPRESSSPIAAPVKKKKRKVKDTAEARRLNPWIDVEASHSGNEHSEGSSDAERLVMGEDDDRSFLQDSPATQASSSYDQSAIYRQSLLTQAPFAANGPVFADRGPRRMFLGDERPLAPITSSPREDEAPDEYMLGSFIVDDDAEISYMHSSEP